MDKSTRRNRSACNSAIFFIYESIFPILLLMQGTCDRRIMMASIEPSTVKAHRHMPSSCHPSPTPRRNCSTPHSATLYCAVLNACTSTSTRVYQPDTVQSDGRTGSPTGFGNDPSRVPSPGGRKTRHQRPFRLSNCRS